MAHYYHIAGLTVQMDGTGRTESFSRPYEIAYAENPDIIVQPDFDGVRKRIPGITELSCEYLATGESFYNQLLNYDGLLLHSSALVKDGRAYLFTAPCGTGKSTHVCLWRRVFGDEQVRVLNDDKPALRLENGVWYAYGTPWSGKTGQNLNLKVPLAGIAVIERAADNSIEPMAGGEAVKALLSQTSKVVNARQKILQIDLLDKLMTQVPIWKLKCNMEPEAAIVAYEAMSGQKWRN